VHAITNPVSLSPFLLTYHAAVGFLMDVNWAMQDD
jgi:hypothetical protein